MKGLKRPIKVAKYDNFKVYLLDNKYTFFHIEIDDNLNFYERMFDYFFDEDKLISYIENNSSIKFTPSIKDFATLYKSLSSYIDDLYDDVNINEIDAEVIKILKEEYELNDEGNGKLKVRLDKMGKIGEYIFYCILKDYFKFDCIIPKAQLSTSRNMSVYGIDSLFYSKEDNMILFGESKLSKNLNYGIKLIKKSLKTYENSIINEYTCTLSNRRFKNELKIFTEKFADISDQCISMGDFIEKADITKIGIPIFIAHGKEKNIPQIIRSLHRIPERDLLGIKTVYYFISLPIVDKSKFISVFTKKIKERREKYESEYKKL